MYQERVIHIPGVEAYLRAASVHEKFVEVCQENICERDAACQAHDDAVDAQEFITLKMNRLALEDCLKQICQKRRICVIATPMYLNASVDNRLQADGVVEGGVGVDIGVKVLDVAGRELAVGDCVASAKVS